MQVFQFSYPTKSQEWEYQKEVITREDGTSWTRYVTSLEKATEFKRQASIQIRSEGMIDYSDSEEQFRWALTRALQRKGISGVRSFLGGKAAAGVYARCIGESDAAVSEVVSKMWEKFGGQF